jgi:acetylornithine/N-succinyldiaminopimelate aminotransferase
MNSKRKESAKRKLSITLNPPFPQNYAKEFLVLEKGEGTYVEDSFGNRFLDFTSGIAVNALGHGRKDLAKVAMKQMQKLIHVSNLYTTKPALDLAQKLITLGDFMAVHFGNSGSEANEAAIKYARKYALSTKGPEHHKILSFQGAFHGRTYGALSATPTEKYRKPFSPMVPGMVHLPYNDVKALEETLDESFAAVIVEVLQGEGGLTQASPEFLKALRKLADQHNVLVIVDEIQSGLGRTGDLLACHTLNFQPDILTLSKPLAGGLPLSATLIPKKVNKAISIGDHGTTFGGGPVTTAVAGKVWEIITSQGFLDKVKKRAEFLHSGLFFLQEKYAFVSDVKGLGLLAGLAFTLPQGKDSLMGIILSALRDKGLLALRAGTNVLRLAPPLTVKKKEIEEALAIIDLTLSEVQAEFH